MNGSRKNASKRHEDYPKQLRKAMGKSLPHKGLPLTCSDRRVRWSDRMLVIAAVLMSWARQPTFEDAFHTVYQCVVSIYPSRKRPGRTVRGFLKALCTRGHELASALKSHLQEQTRQRSGNRWRSGRWVPLAVDGSRIECPHTAANEAVFECAGKEKTGPQQQLTTIFHVITGLLWDYRRGMSRVNERTHLRDMLAGLPSMTLLLMDAGFTGYDLLQSIQGFGHDFIVRVGRNVSLLTGLDYEVEVDRSTVWLWPRGQRNQCPPMRLRKVEFKHKGHKVCLLTSVLSRDALSDEQVKQWYKLRWHIEVQYRNLKQTMGHRRMLSDSPAMAEAELDWALLGLWLLELMLVRTRKKRGPSYSVARGLRAVRRAMTHHGRPPAGRLEKQLRNATLDGYQRNRAKKARGWPHKKTPPLCGEPKIRMATPKEIQQAQAFHAPTPPH